jgi:hypothetical protein
MRPAAMPSRAASRFILLLMIAAIVVLIADAIINPARTHLALFFVIVGLAGVRRHLVNLGRTRLAVDE